MVLRALTKVWLRFLVQLHDVVRDEWLERVVAIRQVEQGVGHGAEGFGWWVGEDTTGVIRKGAISDALMSRDVIGDKAQNGNIPGVSDGCCVFFTFHVRAGSFFPSLHSHFACWNDVKLCQWE